MSTENAIHAALAKAQAEFTTVEKDRVNPHFKAKYATLASMIDATRPALAANGLAVTQVFVEGERGVSLITRLLHVSGDAIESVLPLFNATKGAQVFGSEITYMRRYSYAAILNIVAEEDDDGTEAQKAGASQRRVVDPVSTAPPAVYKAPPPQSTRVTVRERLRAVLAHAKSLDDVHNTAELDWVRNALQFAPADKKHEINGILSEAYNRFAVADDGGAANEPEKDVTFAG